MIDSESVCPTCKTIEGTVCSDAWHVAPAAPGMDGEPTWYLCPRCGGGKPGIEKIKDAPCEGCWQREYESLDDDDKLSALVERHPIPSARYASTSQRPAAAPADAVLDRRAHEACWCSVHHDECIKEVSWKQGAEEQRRLIGQLRASLKVARKGLERCEGFATEELANANDDDPGAYTLRRIEEIAGETLKKMEGA